VGQNVSAVAGKLPYDCLLVAIQRDGALLFPHGHTLFLPGDEVVAFVRASEEKALEACLRGQL
jgi:Trk K+ transport system NAD-binding subunit